MVKITFEFKKSSILNIPCWDFIILDVEGEINEELEDELCDEYGIEIPEKFKK